MLKTIGKWVAKKAAGQVAGTIVALTGGGDTAQEMAKVAAEVAVGGWMGD